MPAPAPTLHLKLMGCPELRRGDQPLKCSNTGLRVLAVLALDGPTTRLKLADLLWDAPTDRALHNLRMALYKLRQTLVEDAGVLHEENSHLSLDLTRLHVDVLHVASPTNQELMSGHRTGGSEGWLDWAGETEERLRNAWQSPVQNFPAETMLNPTSQQDGLPSTSAGKTRPSHLLTALDAVTALQEGSFLQAEQLVRDVLQHVTGGRAAAIAWDTLAHLSLEQDQHAHAHHCIHQAFNAHPEPTAELYYTAAYLADLQGEAARAEQLAHYGLRLLPAHASAAQLQAVIASSYDTRKNFKVARQWHELALESARRAPIPLEHCGVLTFHLWHLNVTGEPQRTRMLAQEALSLGEFSMTPYIRNSLGVAELRLGALDAALDTLAPHLQASGRAIHLIAQTQAAVALWQMGERDQASQTVNATAAWAAKTEDGRARYEWAVAALTVDPARWHQAAARCVQGISTNDCVVVQQYANLQSRWIGAHPV